MEKVIYQPKGKAAEYSEWAANFYNGCSARCEYCYNRKGRGAKILGGDVPTLKKCLKNEEYAEMQFLEEAVKNIDELRKHGLFFNFVSDPFLKETFRLNLRAMAYCDIKWIPIKILTKQTWWVNDVINGKQYFPPKYQIEIDFTLTGHDELEPGASTNAERIKAMKKLHDAGFKTGASIEPIIDLESSMDMISKTLGYCDLYKIGLKSGGKYRPLLSKIKSKIYFKDSLLNQAGIRRNDLLENCVTRDFNL